jgi:hypothetical protein
LFGSIIGERQRYFSRMIEAGSTAMAWRAGTTLEIKTIAASATGAASQTKKLGE